MPNSYNQKRKNYCTNIRIETIKAYGGRCVKCGEPHPEFLTLYPKDSVGIGYRKKHFNNSTNLYLRLRKEGYKKKHFGILCMNCNWSRRHEGKVYATNWINTYRRGLKKDIIREYGGECVCCGEKELKFLTLDHPDGKGQEDRKPHRTVCGQIYGYLKKNGFPRKDYYRVLCMNCNWIRRFGGICPHQRNKE